MNEAPVAELPPEDLELSVEKDEDGATTAGYEAMESYMEGDMDLEDDFIDDSDIDSLADIDDLDESDEEGYF